MKLSELIEWLNDVCKVQVAVTGKQKAIIIVNASKKTQPIVLQGE